MRRITAWLAALIFALPCAALSCSVVCRAQTCTGTTYTEINAPADNTLNANITGLTAIDDPGVGTWCYTVETWAIVPPNVALYGISPPSSAVMVTVPNGYVAQIEWDAPDGADTFTSTGYILSRGPAMNSTPAALQNLIGTVL
jgi:hypothetical protein